MESPDSTTPPLHHSTTSRTQPRPRPAFTLLELVLVMAVLCIVMALAAPSLRNFGRGRGADDCASQIVALTQWARTQSISRGVTYRLNLDPGQGTYWLTVQDPSGTGYSDLGEEFGRVFTVPEGITISWDAPQQQDGQYVEFHPTGRTDPATIRVTSASGVTTEIACRSATELFQVTDGTTVAQVRR